MSSAAKCPTDLYVMHHLKRNKNQDKINGLIITVYALSLASVAYL
jgi:hypothetical protein